MKRYDPGVELAKDLIVEAVDSGSLGPLLAVDSLCNGGDWLHNVEAPIRVAPPSPLPGPAAATYPDACRTQDARVAYDWLLNIFSHTVNLCHFLLGMEMTPASAQFRRSKAFSSSLYADDVLVTIRGAMTRAHEWREETILVFERGEIRIATPTPMNRQRVAEVTVRSAAGVHQRPSSTMRRSAGRSTGRPKGSSGPWLAANRLVPLPPKPCRMSVSCSGSSKSRRSPSHADPATGNQFRLHPAVRP